MLIPLFDPFVDGFELSTHYIAASGSLLLETTKKARSLTKKPVFMKLSAHGGDIVANAIVCEKGGADGITAINSVARVRGRSRLEPGFVLPIISSAWHPEDPSATSARARPRPSTATPRKSSSPGTGSRWEWPRCSSRMALVRVLVECTG